MMTKKQNKKPHHSWKIKLNKNKAVFTFPRVLCSTHQVQAKWLGEPRCPEWPQEQLQEGQQTRLGDRWGQAPEHGAEPAESGHVSPRMNWEAGVSSERHLPPPQFCQEASWGHSLWAFTWVLPRQGLSESSLALQGVSQGHTLKKHPLSKNSWLSGCFWEQKWSYSFVQIYVQRH